MPILTGYDGVIFKDIAAHRSVYEGCLLAQANGATFIDFKHNDVADLEEKLARYPYEKTKLIAIDGVYSMSGAYPPLPDFARLAKQYNAWIYMDDAHGIGIIGEDPTAEMPYGTRGNGIVKHFGLKYERDRMIYVRACPNPIHPLARLSPVLMKRPKHATSQRQPLSFQAHPLLPALPAPLLGSSSTVVRATCGAHRSTS